MQVSVYIKNYYRKSLNFRILVHLLIGYVRLVLNFFYLFLYRVFYKKNGVRVAFVGPIHSQHFVNFLQSFKQHFASEDFKMIQIGSDPNYLKMDSAFGHVIVDASVYTLMGYSMRNEEWQKSLFLNAVNRIGSFAAKYNDLTLSLFKPDIIWIHDLQSGGYIASNFISHIKTKSSVTICASVYGNDLYFFRSAPLHLNKLRGLLKNLDFLHVESEREKDIAMELGFVGKFFPVSCCTMSSMEKFRKLEVNFKLWSKDIFIVVKGSYFWRSNILTFLHDIEKDVIFWKDKRIYFVNATDEDIFHITRVKCVYNLDLEYSKAIPHSEFTLLLSRAQFFLTLNLSDGIPNASAEATYVNCIPVFSNHTGLSDSMSSYLRDLIVYEFGRVNFSHLFSLLGDLNEMERSLVIENLKKLFNDRLYNEKIQRGIFDLVRNYSREKKRSEGYGCL